MGVVAAPLAVSTALTVNTVIGEPPSVAGGAQLTDTDRTPAVTAPIAGAAGTDTGETALERAERGPVPTALLAATWSW
jgi:hypothetical protein